MYNGIAFSRDVLRSDLSQIYFNNFNASYPSFLSLNGFECVREYERWMNVKVND